METELIIHTMNSLILGKKLLAQTCRLWTNTSDYNFNLLKSPLIMFEKNIRSNETIE